ncbi:hypothetical protein AVDCRST_MAG84-6831 [uncultured Microcoleus sp.]|uniref:Uncharacterized protein n=1 Tax=uncultured Microcoleus sp. TaxID=259945 RepID=A0A6J4PHT5_9CYAN|nr:hypothetical protein AVDCRST_MAG84-6831 [uncultured Microcoleus sp.]
MPTRNQTARCIPQAVNTSLTNDPHLEKVGNNYKKVDPFTLAHQARPSQPLGDRRLPRTYGDRYTAKLSYLGMLQPEPDKFPKCDRAKYLGLLRSSQNQYSLQNLFILSAGARQNRASPNLRNPLFVEAPARLPNFINLSVAIQ